MTTIDDLRADLADDDGSLPSRWNENDDPGATLVGRLVRYESIATKIGISRIAVIRSDPDGEVVGVMLGRSVLKKHFDELSPKPGDTIGLKYHGQIKPKAAGASSYFNYSLRVVPATSPPVAPQPDIDELPWDTAADDDSIPF